MALVLPRSPGAGDAGKLKGSRSERVEKAVVHNVCPGGAANSVRITSHLGYGLGCVCVPCLDIFVSLCLCISHKTIRHFREKLKRFLLKDLPSFIAIPFTTLERVYKYCI